MASWFLLELDTHAPIVTFGAADSSGGTLVVPYTIDEPAIDSAWVVDSTGFRVDLDVQPDRLFGVLPADIAGGYAVVHAHVVDSVGNEAERTTVVLLAGDITPEPPPRIYPGRPEGVKPRPRKFITSRSRLRGSCPATVRRGVARTVSGAGTGSAATTLARVSASSPLAVSSSARTTAIVHVEDHSAARATLSNVSLARRPGRSVEEALLLDLL